VILPNSGHMAFVDQPNLWNKSVAEFVSGSASPVAAKGSRK
jgi:pimeloyl-ACP methyl ester carboxylesterase